ncbi:putative Heterokaryon incompatibility domain-containing protein [Seiridium unicorne]|uniref:Heterokaryon incompatibility domain-containing protein n=1 Tax=Seiridium unicorne TaxID=138068 RepID=A0ABR2UPL8_9PEZI
MTEVRKVELHSCQSCRHSFASPEVARKLDLNIVSQNASNGCELFQWVIRKAKQAYGDPPPPDLVVWVTRFSEYDDDAKMHQISTEVVVVNIDSESSGQRQHNEPLMVQAYEGGIAAKYVTSRPYERNRRLHSHTWKQWMDDCSLNHPVCGPGMEVMPSRLIQITNGTAELEVRLHTVTKGTNRKYAALSYSWGGDQIFKTTKARLPSYQSSIPWDLLKPYATITNAIRVTHSLGLEYLWIDALCIVQDDDDDKAHELGRMGGIYAGASITVRASMCTASRNPFIDAKVPVDELPICEVLLPMDGGMEVPVQLSQPPSNFREPIDSRAWCFQERMLSRRNLSFDSRFAWWSCQSSVKLDGGPASFVKGITTGAELVGMRDHSLRDPDGALQRWIAYVKDYQARQLTVGTDKFPAIAAVAEYLATFIPGDYIAGLWSYDLPSQLLWHIVPPWPDKILPRPSYRAPTWSWASVDDRRVEFEADQWKSNLESRLQLVRHSIKPTFTSVPFGAVTAASITVQGRLKKASLKDGSVLDSKEMIERDTKFTDSNFSIDFTMDTADDRAWFQEADAVYFLEVATNCEDHILGLLLKPRGQATYERVGKFRILCGSILKASAGSADDSDSDGGEDEELSGTQHGTIHQSQSEQSETISEDDDNVEWDDDDDGSLFETVNAEEFFSGLEIAEVTLI